MEYLEFMTLKEAVLKQPLIPVYSLLCNVTVFVKQHLKNSPCAASCYKNNQEESELLHVLFSLDLANACQPRNSLARTEEGRGCQDNLRRRRRQVGVGDRWDGEADFFILRTVSSISSCQPVGSLFYRYLCVVPGGGGIFVL